MKKHKIFNLNAYFNLFNKKLLINCFYYNALILAFCFKLNPFIFINNLTLFVVT